MILKTLRLLTLVTLLLTLTHCEIQDAPKSAPHKQTPPHLPPTNPPTEPPPNVVGTPICYLKICFVTLPVSQIEDPTQEYIYPNPESFSNPTMRPQYAAPLYFLDLSAIDPNTQLAQNFRVAEFMSTQKGQYGLLSSDLITNMQLIRNAVGRLIQVNSGYRSPGYNRRIDGSAKWSRHTYGDAVDFSIPGLKISDLTEICKSQNASFTLTYENHIHCDWRLNPLDPSFYGEHANKTRPAPEPPYTTAEYLSQHSEIQMQTLGESRYLTTYVPLEEESDEGTPTHVWTVLLPNGRTIQSNTSVLKLPLESGRYEVQVEIGGSIKLENTFVW